MAGAASIVVDAVGCRLLARGLRRTRIRAVDDIGRHADLDDTTPGDASTAVVAGWRRRHELCVANGGRCCSVLA